MVIAGDYSYSEHFIIYRIVESVCCMPESVYITLYVNYTSIKEKSICWKNKTISAFWVNDSSWFQGWLLLDLEPV